MLVGDYRGAWLISDRVLELRSAEYEQGLPQHRRSVWNGQPLDGKRVLVRCHHGLGDTIQFVRYLPMLERFASKVIFCPQPALAELFSQDPSICRFMHFGPDVPDHDADVEIMELAHVFRTTLDTIPAGVPYISSPAVEPSDEHFSVGLVWKAGNWDDRRSIHFDELEPLSRVPDAALFSLQLDPESAGWREGGIKPLDAGSLTKTAAIIRSLDLIVTVDTMAAHLAGALGKAVWLLLPHDADWRWMRGREDSEWYPTMRLFRQQRPGEWGWVISSVADELARLASIRDRAASPRDRRPVPRHQFPPSTVPPPP